MMFLVFNSESLWFDSIFHFALSAYTDNAIPIDAVNSEQKRVEQKKDDLIRNGARSIE